VGWILFLYYIGAFLFYLYVRITKTLNLGKKYTWYGIVLLVVECIGATTVVIYGINLLFNPVHETFPDDERQPGCPKVPTPPPTPSLLFSSGPPMSLSFLSTCCPILCTKPSWRTSPPPPPFAPCTWL